MINLRKAEQEEGPSTVTQPQAVYVHIPFCRHKCFYCDFNTYAVKGQPVDDYMAALDREMALTLADRPAGEVRTIFVGGGTPTILEADQMARFLERMQHWFPRRSEDFEFTMEANPGTTDPDKLKAMKAGGVNRISFGAQSFNNELLKRIGRIHEADDVRRSIAYARDVGIDNLSVDLMFGLPDQTLAILEDSVAQALSLELSHYSAYSLKVEENTPFYALEQKGELPLPSEDEELAMYQSLMRMMAEAGFKQYEISNFARPGCESRHNTVYWRNEDYFGFGAGAHGYARGVRHANIKPVRSYMEAAFAQRMPRAEQREIDLQEQQEDFMMLGLRLLEGIDRGDYLSRYGVSPEQRFGKEIETLLARQLLERTANGYRLTAQGLIYGNDVFAQFI